MASADRFPELDPVEHATPSAAHVVDVPGAGLAPRELAMRVDPKEPETELSVHRLILTTLKGRFGGFSSRTLESLRP